MPDLRSSGSTRGKPVKKLSSLVTALLLLVLFTGCSSDVLDDDGTKHITFINNMDVVVTSVTATVDGTETSNLLSANTQLNQSDRTMLKIPASSGNQLTNVGLTVTDSKGVVYKFTDLDIKNAGSLTFELDSDGDASVKISS